jgi:hypothetical protein
VALSGGVRRRSLSQLPAGDASLDTGSGMGVCPWPRAATPEIRGWILACSNVPGRKLPIRPTFARFRLSSSIERSFGCVTLRAGAIGSLSASAFAPTSPERESRLPVFASLRRGTPKPWRRRQAAPTASGLNCQGPRFLFGGWHLSFGDDRIAYCVSSPPQAPGVQGTHDRMAGTYGSTGAVRLVGSVGEAPMGWQGKDFASRRSATMRVMTTVRKPMAGTRHGD